MPINKQPKIKPEKKNTQKGKLHPRNRHQGSYDFKVLQEVCPDLAAFVVLNHAGAETIDFASPVAVKILNQALLRQAYGVTSWNIPENYLCPPIPGRADYLHYAADLLAESNEGEIPTGSRVRVLDIGVGANCIYPIIGHFEYGWSFVGSDIDRGALTSAHRIVEANLALAAAVELRHQASPSRILKGMIQANEWFELSFCNPPFHASAEEAEAVNLRKWRNLGKAAVANFGGRSNELWCEGGEVEFVRRLIGESVMMRENCRWFSSLVSKEDSLPAIREALRRAKARTVREVEMAQGQKKSRFVAWTFL